MIKALVPLSKLPQTLSEGDLRLKSVVALQGGGIRIRRGHIARLHRHQLLVGLEVEILWQNASPHQFLLRSSCRICTKSNRLSGCPPPML